MVNNINVCLNTVNDECTKRGMTDYIPLYPMLRVVSGKLYIGLMLVNENTNIWDAKEDVKPEYWVLLDINDNKILEFNKTKDKDYVIGDLIPKKMENKKQAISKYIVKKTLQYKDYLINDIKNEELPLQKELSSIFGKEFEIEGEKVNINDYVLSNFEEEIKNKINELVDVFVKSKYSSFVFYYDQLFNNIINDYKQNKNIDNKKINLCIEIMNSYYENVIGIDNFFNVKN